MFMFVFVVFCLLFFFFFTFYLYQPKMFVCTTLKIHKCDNQALNLESQASLTLTQFYEISRIRFGANNSFSPFKKNYKRSQDFNRHCGIIPKCTLSHCQETIIVFTPNFLLYQRLNAREGDDGVDPEMDQRTIATGGFGIVYMNLGGM